MTDTTHWAPSDAMAALERGEVHKLTVFGIAWARSMWCAAVFDYVGQDRWLDVARAAAPPSGPLANAIAPEVLRGDRRTGLNDGGPCILSGRRGGKTAAGRAWAEANGATVLSRSPEGDDFHDIHEAISRAPGKRVIADTSPHKVRLFGPEGDR